VRGCLFQFVEFDITPKDALEATMLPVGYGPVGCNFPAFVASTLYEGRPPRNSAPEPMDARADGSCIGGAHGASPREENGCKEAVFFDIAFSVHNLAADDGGGAIALGAIDEE